MSSQYHFENYCLFLFCHSYMPLDTNLSRQIRRDKFVETSVLVDKIWRDKNVLDIFDPTHFRPERADFRLEKADSRPERADFRPERVDFRPERADFRPERAWGRRTDRGNDGMTNKSPPVFYRTSSPLGPLPKKASFTAVFGL